MAAPYTNVAIDIEFHTQAKIQAARSRIKISQLYMLAVDKLVQEHTPEEINKMFKEMSARGVIDGVKEAA